MARTERTAAVLLRSVAYGEADRIVTLLTEARGKVALMARGARKSTRRFVGALEPYALIEAEIALGQGSVGRLAEARVVRAFPGILASLEKISIAAAGLEIARETVGEAEEPDERLLPTIVRFFELLEESDALIAVHLAFTLRLLALTGHAPNLEHCGRCARIAPNGKAALFDPTLGAIVCRDCGGAPDKLSGGQRAAMIAAGTRAWDSVDERLDAPAAGLISAFLERHLTRRLAGGDVVSQVREVQRRSKRP